jgi:hypothetical protein
MPKCKICKTKFTPIRALQPTCQSSACMYAYAISYANKAIERKKKAEKKALKEKTTNWKNKTQTRVQEIARLIDRGLPCPSKKTFSKQDGGHLFSKGGHPQMRYNLHGIHRQSAQSNHFQNDDAGFRKGISDEYGEAYFDFIESLKQTPQPHYKEIEYMDFYQRACKIANELKKANKTYSLEERIELRNKVNLEVGIYEEKYCVYPLTQQ